TTTTHKTLRGPRGAMILCRADLADAIDRAVFPALQGGPHNHTTAAIGVALAEAATPAFQEYGQQVVRNAKVLAVELLERGFSLIAGGTDTHLILIDLTDKGVIAKKAARALDRAGIVCNYNTIPYDARKPFSPSGIRIGTPSVTSRGMREEEMRRIAAWLAEAVDHVDDEEALDRIAAAVRDFCRAFPVPGISDRIASPA
ncbi:MAG: serine hydroxymethyltransferase, partial [Chloroflexi bacterium]|nr:serine hydroxymethyltransferase [Chloroflexota bacterium]